MLKNKSYPRWSAPFLGAVVGGEVAIHIAHSEPDALSLCIGIAAGAAAGSLIFLLEPPAPAVSQTEGPGIATFSPHGSLIGRVLAVLAVLSFVLPFVGLLVSAAALVLNRKVRHWPRVVSWVGAGLSIFMTGLFLFLTIVVRHK